MKFKDFLQFHKVILDGGMGTLLQEKGLKAGQFPELWNLTHPEEITAIHKAYYESGANVICTNTFGANALKFDADTLRSVICAAVSNAKTARETANSTKEKFIALDIGPTGKLLKPYGDLDFEDAVSIFAETVKIGVSCGVDLILIETMNDAYETKAAVLAAKETCDLPIIVTNAYGSDGKLMTGATPGAMVATLEGLGVDAIGANCSLGPRQLMGVAEELLACASVPVALKPNAGLPHLDGEKTVFDVDPDEFADVMAILACKGLRLLGGCCGTTPAHIAALSEKVAGLDPIPVTDKGLTVVSSYTHAVEFGEKPLLIGERINPTGKKRLKAAILEEDFDYILSEGVAQQEKKVHVLDVNVGLPGIDEAGILTKAVTSLQEIIDLPLQIDTADVDAMEAALRRYNGKALINSLSGKEESMAAIFPLVKKYGGVVVALTLDENGIPATAEGRFEIAEKILKTAEKYGISRKNIVFDTLCMPISADSSAGKVTLQAMARIRRELGCHTILGVSNVSFGLPNRDAVNGVFFTLAMENGLSAAIMNPNSSEMWKAYYGFNALKGLDENCAAYMENAASFCAVQAVAAAPAAVDFGEGLQYAIGKGLKDQAAAITARLLETTAPLEVVNTQIIPALDKVGKGFEEKKVYLPQLLMSAEAAKAAFEVIKTRMAGGEKGSSKAIFVIATVEGDIHDIGKNIVKLLLENYGYRVMDLGKDVPPQQVVDAVIRHQAPLCGLSALMTTTVPAMEATIKLLRQQAPWCKVVVGGAVLTKDYADAIGADFYAKDAMEAVRFAEKF
jgi:5-methyltetrahydrofolate--homocysteine methyltransferase